MKVIKDIIVADVFKYIADGVVVKGSELIVTDNAGFSTYYYADDDSDFVCSINEDLDSYLNDQITPERLRWKAELRIPEQFYLLMPESKFYLSIFNNISRNMVFFSLDKNVCDGFKILFTEDEIATLPILKKYKNIVQKIPAIKE